MELVPEAVTLWRARDDLRRALAPVPPVRGGRRARRHVPEAAPAAVLRVRRRWRSRPSRGTAACNERPWWAAPVCRGAAPPGVPPAPRRRGTSRRGRRRPGPHGVHRPGEDDGLCRRPAAPASGGRARTALMPDRRPRPRHTGAPEGEFSVQGPPLPPPPPLRPDQRSPFADLDPTAVGMLLPPPRPDVLPGAVTHRVRRYLRRPVGRPMAVLLRHPHAGRRDRPGHDDRTGGPSHLGRAPVRGQPPRGLHGVRDLPAQRARRPDPRAVVPAAVLGHRPRRSASPASSSAVSRACGRRCTCRTGR